MSTVSVNDYCGLLVFGGRRVPGPQGRRNADPGSQVGTGIVCLADHHRRGSRRRSGW